MNYQLTLLEKLTLLVTKQVSLAVLWVVLENMSNWQAQRLSKGVTMNSQL